MNPALQLKSRDPFLCLKSAYAVLTFAALGLGTPSMHAAVLRTPGATQVEYTLGESGSNFITNFNDTSGNNRNMFGGNGNENTFAGGGIASGSTASLLIINGKIKYGMANTSGISSDYQVKIFLSSSDNYTPQDPNPTGPQTIFAIDGISFNRQGLIYSGQVNGTTVGTLATTAWTGTGLMFQKINDVFSFWTSIDGGVTWTQQGSDVTAAGVGDDWNATHLFVKPGGGDSYTGLADAFSVASLLTVCDSACAGAEFYVSPTGDDANPGTRAAPFLTLERAREVVRPLLPAMTENITVNLRGGTHRRTTTFLLNETDSGRNGARVIWRNAEGEHPTISGGKIVTGWTLFDQANNIWRSDPVSCAIRQFYVNGVPAVRARGPNPDSYHAVTSWDFAGRRINVPASTIGAWGANPAGVEFVGRGGWMTHHSRIKAITYTGDTAHLELMEPEAGILFPVASNNFGFLYRSGFFFENALGLLDSPREWYQDGERRIYYRPAVEEDLGSAQGIAPCVETLWRMEGSSLGTLVENVTVQGLRFMHSTWMDPSVRGCIELQAVQCASQPWGTRDWYRAPAAVYLAKAARNQFIACWFQNLGATGIELHYGCFANVVEGCAFADIAGNGISMGRAHEPPTTHPYAPADDRDVGEGDVIRDNFITRVGSVYRGAVGIFAGYCRGISIEHNEVTTVPYSGISLGWGWNQNPTPMRNNSIVGNRVTDVMQFLKDGGGIYTLSDQPNSVWRRNYIARSGDHGIYPDEGTGHYQIEQNVTEQIANAWLYIWTSTIHLNSVNDCYTDKQYMVNKGTDCPVTNTRYHPNRDWPAEALAIISESGPRPPYRGSFASLIPVPNPNLAATGVATASSEYSSQHQASKANDNMPAGWSPGGADLRPWLQIDLLAPTVFRRVELVTRQEAIYDQPTTRRNFEIQASNDSNFGSYVVLGSQGATAVPHMSTWRIDVASPGSYRYLRAIKSVDEYFFISELRVFPQLPPFGTSPDADRDDLPDAWETANGLSSDLRDDAAEDWDDDGHTNQHEYEAGTDPHNPLSQLRMADCHGDGSNIVFSWVGGTMATQTIEFATNPAGPWVAVETIPPPTTPLMTRSLPRSGGNPVGFYRVGASRGQSPQ